MMLHRTRVNTNSSINAVLYYATNASGSWVKAPVDNKGGYYGRFNSIAIDSTGKAHVSYIDGTKFNLMYATNESGSWVNLAVDSKDSVGFMNSITLDSLGKVHIIYSDATNSDLKYATNASN